MNIIFFLCGILIFVAFFCSLKVISENIGCLRSISKAVDEHIANKKLSENKESGAVVTDDFGNYDNLIKNLAEALDLEEGVHCGEPAIFDKIRHYRSTYELFKRTRADLHDYSKYREKLKELDELTKKIRQFIYYSDLDNKS